MHLHSFYTHLCDENAAIAEVAKQIALHDIRYLICYYTEEYDVEKIRLALITYFPTIAFHGCSSFEGIMTEQGYHYGPVIAIMGISSSKGQFGTGITPFPSPIHSEISYDEIAKCVHLCIEKALENADRTGEIPNLLILHATPGYEETIIECIDRHFGTLVPLIGGSAADNLVQNKWSILTEETSLQSGISISAIYSEEGIFTSFNAGYLPTKFSGVITKAKKREIIEIDNRPAGEVYNEWTNEGLSISNKQFLFDKTTQFPLGRKVEKIAGQTFYKLSHPVRRTDNNGIELFTTIHTGETVHLMTGNKELLVTRAERIALSGIKQQYPNIEISGGIAIFCAGPMHYVKDGIHDIRKQIYDVLQQPFISPFTFGEQGRFINGDNVHGNLMISSAFFHRPCN